MRSAGLLLAGLLFVAWPSLADDAGPYYPTAVNDLKDARVHRNVHVDSAGRCSTKHRCDFRDLGDALAWVAAQSPTLDAQWTVHVLAGDTDATVGYSYQEASLTIPPYTNVQGTTSPSALPGQVLGRPMIQITGTTGVGVTLGTGASLTNLGFLFTGAWSAGYVGFRGASVNTLTNCMVIYGFTGTANVQTDIFNPAAGNTIYLINSYVQRFGASMPDTRHVAVSTGAMIISGSWLATSGQAVVVDVSGGAVRLLNSRIYPTGAASTLDLNRTGGTLSVDNTAYATESGTITRAGSLTPRITYGNTAPAACTPPEIFVDIDSSTLCACTSANTFKCAAIS